MRLQEKKLIFKLTYIGYLFIGYLHFLFITVPTFLPLGNDQPASPARQFQPVPILIKSIITLTCTYIVSLLYNWKLCFIQ